MRVCEYAEVTKKIAKGIRCLFLIPLSYQRSKCEAKRGSKLFLFEAAGFGKELHKV